MPTSGILSERRGQALILTFNRPEQRNAMTLDMATQLHAALKSATSDRSVRGVLLMGAGDHFMNGVDMEIFKGDMTAALDVANQLIMPYHSVIREMQTMDKPVLAAVQGDVVGAGLSLMLGADLVLAAQNTRFHCNFATFGMTPDGGCSHALPRKVGSTKALEIMMLAEAFDAEKAAQLNLVNRVVENDKFKDEALAWLDHLTEGPTRAYGGIKKLVASAFEQTLHAQLGLEHTHHGQNSRSFDFREALKAYLSGRPAKFTGS